MGAQNEFDDIDCSFTPLSYVSLKFSHVCVGKPYVCSVFRPRAAWKPAIIRIATDRSQRYLVSRLLQACQGMHGMATLYFSEVFVFYWTIRAVVFVIRRRSCHDPLGSVKGIVSNGACGRHDQAKVAMGGRGSALGSPSSIFVYKARPI